MDSETAGSVATYGGALGACVSAPPAFFNESIMLTAISALGAFTAVCGLIFTIYHSNRQYALERERLRLDAIELSLRNNAAELEAINGE